MRNNYFDLPELVTLDEYEGDIVVYLEVIYQIFKKDFIDSKFKFEGKRVALKKYPVVEGKEYTFYHFTHDGDIENDRKPNLRRLERIPFPRPMIEKSSHPYLKVWQNVRGRSKRILIYHCDESYLVVLEDRGDFVLPWTAYQVEHKKQEEKLMGEYGKYIKAKTAQ